MQNGGAVLTEYSISDEIFNYIFSPESVIQGTSGGEYCVFGGVWVGVGVGVWMCVWVCVWMCVDVYG